MQWLIDIVYEKVMAAISWPPFYVDRGDALAWDFGTGDFNRDFNWRTLDLSAIVPVNAKAVLFRVMVLPSIVAPYVIFRHVDYGAGFNMDSFKCYITGIVADHSMIIPLDSNRQISYLLGDVGITVINAVVRGWWI